MNEFSKAWSQVKWPVLMFADILVVLFGVFLIYCGMIANSELPNMLDSIINRHFNGEEVPLLGHYIMGIMSDGTLKVVPDWQVRAAIIIGCFQVYIGYLFFNLHKRKRKSDVLFTKKYWTNFYNTIDEIK